MPYVITTKRPTINTRYQDGAAWAIAATDETRTAVATLDEARREAAAECVAAEGATARPDTWDDRFAPFERACESLPESGGTIGPLPDGTVIEVRLMTRDEIVSAVGEARYIAGMTAEEMSAAFNLSHSQAPTAA